MSKWAEKITILKQVGDGLLARLHATYTVMSTAESRPSWLDDKACSKAVEGLTKNFPAMPNDPGKVPGYNQLLSGSEDLHKQLYRYYYAIVDLEEWRRKALELLQEVAKDATALKYDLNSTVAEGWLDILSLYCRLIFLLNMIADRKAILAVYCRAYFHMKMTDEPSFAKVASFVKTYSDPTSCFVHDFKSIGDRVVEAVVSMYMPFVVNRDVDALRTKGIHNLTLKPENMGLPSEDAQLYDMLRNEQLYQRIVFGLLVCPGAYANVPLDLLKVVLSESIWTPIYRELCLYIHPFYEAVFKGFKPKKKAYKSDVFKQLSKNLKKARSAIGDAEKQLSGHLAVHHRERRIYLRQELENLLNLFRDKPGLLGPKATLLFSAMAYARDEVMWYFRHRYLPVPKGLKVKGDDFHDSRITDLIYIINQLVLLVRKHADIIRNYYQKFISGLDLRLCREQAERASVPAGPIKGLVDGLLATAGSTQAGSAQDLQAFRLDWFRVESTLSSAQSATFIETLKKFVASFIAIARHSRYVDDLEGIFVEYIDLQDLWYFRAGFVQEFVGAIAGGTTQPARSMVYFRLLSQIAQRVNQYTPEERDPRGAACVQTAQDFLNRIAIAINNGLVGIAGQFAAFDDQLNEANAAYPLLAKSKDWKPDKGFQAPQTPGTESEFANRPRLENLRVTEAVTFQLCSALNEVETIQIHDTIFAPREFVRERLTTTLKGFMFKKVLANGNTMEKPSVLERKINNFCSVFQLVENYLDLNLSAVFREVFVSQVYHSSLGPMGQVMNSGEKTENFDNIMVKPIVLWYTNFVSSYLIDRNTVVWSPLRKAFVSVSGEKFRAEEYVNLMELKALCRLIGPYGVKLLDNEVLKLVAGQVRRIKDLLQQNRAPCMDMQKTLAENEAAALGHVKAFRDLDSMVGTAATVGLVLHFRELLHEALRFVMQEQVPFLFSAIDSAFHQYRRNTFMVPDYMQIDVLASEYGVDVETADQVLKTYLRDVIGTSGDDATLWSLLPVAFATAFISKSWAEADYRTAVEAYRTNLHCVAKTLIELMVSVRALTSVTNDEREIKDMLLNFARQSSVLLLRANQVDARSLQKQVGVALNSWSDLVIFIDMFVEQAPFVTRDELDAVLPYAILRSAYSEVYTSKASASGSTMRKKGKEPVDGI